MDWPRARGISESRAALSSPGPLHSHQCLQTYGPPSLHPEIFEALAALLINKTWKNRDLKFGEEKSKGKESFMYLFEAGWLGKGLDIVLCGLDYRKKSDGTLDIVFTAVYWAAAWNNGTALGQDWIDKHWACRVGWWINPGKCIVVPSSRCAKLHGTKQAQHKHCPMEMTVYYIVVSFIRERCRPKGPCTDLPALLWS